MKRKSRVAVGHAIEKRATEDVDGRAARPQEQLAPLVGLRAAERRRQVAVLDDLRALPSTCRPPRPSARRPTASATTLIDIAPRARHAKPRKTDPQTMAVGLLDLVIDAENSMPRRCISSSKPALASRRSYSAVSVGTRAQAGLLRTAARWPVARVDGRHVALLPEEKDVAGWQAEELVLVEKRDRLFVRGVAGHDEVGDRFPRSPQARAQEELLGENLERAWT